MTSTPKTKFIGKHLDLKIVNSIRWWHRRTMAYIAIFSILLVTCSCLFYIDIEKIKVLDEIITWFYTIMGSIVGAYMGLSTFDEKWKNEHETKKNANNTEQK